MLEIKKMVWDQQEFCGGYLADIMTISCIEWIITFLFSNSCKLDLSDLAKTLQRKSKIKEALMEWLHWKPWLLIFAQYVILDILPSKKEQNVCIDTKCVRHFLRNHSKSTSPERSEALSD